MIDLPLRSTDLADCRVTILGVTTESPDETGHLEEVTVKLRVHNETGTDWGRVAFRVFLLSEDDRLIDSTDDFQDIEVCAGQTKAFDATIRHVHIALLGQHPENAKVVAIVTGCTYTQAEVGKVRSPHAGPIPVIAEPRLVGGALRVVSASVYRLTNDEYPRHGFLGMDLLVQNLSRRLLPRVEIVADVSRASGRPVKRSMARIWGCEDDLWPGALVRINAQIAASNQALAGLIITPRIGVYASAAEGVAQRQGMTVFSEEQEGLEASPDDTPRRSSLERIELAPIVRGLAECGIRILGAEIRDTPGVDDSRITVRYALHNDTGVDWERIDGSVHLLSADGLLVAQATLQSEEFLAAGSSRTFETIVHARAPSFGPNRTRAHVAVHVHASTCVRTRLGTVSVPATSRCA